MRQALPGVFYIILNDYRLLYTNDFYVLLPLPQKNQKG
jgi:hypothetical protein